ncbi:helix-turn-helix transcriptional regulator [Litoribacter ruber]|uniref:helix-turn-helix domain-containing protein n=1 Tax=Litoribacter ruber TaxID=702568 RepID=UPI001BDA0C78|nr:helix-turn-helix transcriptional regulator [Litoribacter ruber]MBT0813127.1 helix-turn-helix transcriptional regulator [Litoribacter ruber]
MDGFNEMETIGADLRTILKKGRIEDELELERALGIERKLRLLSKESPDLKKTRSDLRDLIAMYEKETWADQEVNISKIEASDKAEELVQKENLFIENRKKLIKQKLQKHSLTQQQLGQILGHHKSYISELMNGISPFSMKDLIIIHNLLKIKLSDLIPTALSLEDKQKLNTRIKELGLEKMV